MLFNRTKLIEGIFFPLLFLFACNEPQKPESYIARVNDSYLTEEKLSDLIDAQVVNGNNRTSAIKNWIRQEILFQEAKKQGILDHKNYKSTIEKSQRQLANSIVLENYLKSWKPEVTEENLKYYFEENKTSFKLAFNSYLLNKVSFTDEDVAVKFRTELIQSDWKSALSKFANHDSIFEVSSNIFIPEQDIYPTKVLRILEGLYPLEISIVISDDRGYYTVVQLLEKYSAGSIPPFEAVKKEVETRYIAASNEVAIENYFDELYSKNVVEINN
jgi:hypothetical protein